MRGGLALVTPGGEPDDAQDDARRDGEQERDEDDPPEALGKPRPAETPRGSLNPKVAGSSPARPTENVLLTGAFAWARRPDAAG